MMSHIVKEYSTKNTLFAFHDVLISGVVQDVACLHYLPSWWVDIKKIGSVDVPRRHLAKVRFIPTTNTLYYVF